MNILFILIPLSLCLAFIGLLGFLWAVKNGQYDDLNKESMKVLDHSESTTNNKGERK